MKEIEFRDEIMALIRQIATGVDLVFRPIVESFGLTMIQVRILFVIERSSSPTVGTIGELVGLSSGNASAMCKKLEKAGFLRRIRAVEDERYVKLSLTGKGKETLEQIDRLFREKYLAILDRVTEEDFALIHAGLCKLKEVISAMSSR